MQDMWLWDRCSSEGQPRPGFHVAVHPLHVPRVLPDPLHYQFILATWSSARAGKGGLAYD